MKTLYHLPKAAISSQCYGLYGRPSSFMGTGRYTGTDNNMTLDCFMNSVTPDFAFIQKFSLPGSAELNVVQDNVGTTTNSALTLARDDMLSSASGLHVDSFVSGGFDLEGSSDRSNQDGDEYVAVTWAQSSDVFSIITHEGTGVAKDIAHGLDTTPTFFLTKNMDESTEDWIVYHKNMDASPETGYIIFNGDPSFNTDSTAWDDTAPDATNIRVGTFDGTNKSGDSYVIYAFTDLAGTFATGSYTGTGSTGNAITGIGFKPRLIMIAPLTGSGNEWTWLIDVLGNIIGIEPSDQFTEQVTVQHSKDSDGFTINSTDSNVNSSGQTYLYVAIK